MTYEQAVKKINSLLVFGSKPGLERVSELIERIGSPDKKLKFVHVAGTNGKGSTCALTASALSEAGYKTGLFISPYVLEFRERFIIDGNMISPQTLADIVSELFPVIEQMRGEEKIITEFEFVLAVALTWFARERCDIVVLETGLGGRFDATNIIDSPLVTAITSISLDHTQILGDTYEKIAFEKCGIIKPDGITVAYGDQQPGAMRVICDTAEERNNILLTAKTDGVEVISSDIRGTSFSFIDEGRPIKLFTRLIGEHQIRNTMTAYMIIRALRMRGVRIPEEAVYAGFAKVVFPARLELLSEKPIILLDGAHNPGGAAALYAAVKKYLSGKSLTGIVGMLGDKDVASAIALLAPLFERIKTVSPDNPRAMSSEELAGIVKKYCLDVSSYDDLSEAWAAARAETKNDGAIVIFGSLYLASDMRRIILSDL